MTETDARPRTLSIDAIFDPTLRMLREEGENVSLDLGDGLTLTYIHDWLASLSHNSIEIAQYQTGMMHAAIALFHLDSPYAQLIIQENDLKLGPPTHDKRCARQLCRNELHVSETREELRPMVVWHVRWRSYADLTFEEVTPADQNWQYTNQYWRLPERAEDD